MRETATNKVGRALKAKPDPSREAARADLEYISFTKCDQIMPDMHTYEKLPPTRLAEP